MRSGPFSRTRPFSVPGWVGAGAAPQTRVRSKKVELLGAGRGETAGKHPGPGLSGHSLLKCSRRRVGAAREPRQEKGRALLVTGRPDLVSSLSHPWERFT